jgi:hypothetical protein
MYMFDENEEENEKKNQRTNEGSPRSQARAAAYPVFSIVFSNVCAHAAENDRGRLKIEPVFILMLSVYYYYIIIIFNAFTTSTISKISNYSLSVRANSKTFARSFLVSSLRSI